MHDSALTLHGAAELDGLSPSASAGAATLRLDSQSWVGHGTIGCRRVSKMQHTKTGHIDD